MYSVNGNYLKVKDVKLVDMSGTKGGCTHA